MGCSSWGHKESGTTEATRHAHRLLFGLFLFNRRRPSLSRPVNSPTQTLTHKTNRGEFAGRTDVTVLYDIIGVTAQHPGHSLSEASHRSGPYFRGVV